MVKVKKEQRQQQPSNDDGDGGIKSDKTTTPEIEQIISGEIATQEEYDPSPKSVKGETREEDNSDTDTSSDDEDENKDGGDGGVDTKPKRTKVVKKKSSSSSQGKKKKIIHKEDPIKRGRGRPKKEVSDEEHLHEKKKPRITTAMKPREERFIIRKNKLMRLAAKISYRNFGRTFKLSRGATRLIQKSILKSFNDFIVNSVEIKDQLERSRDSTLLLREAKAVAHWNKKNTFGSLISVQ